MVKNTETAKRLQALWLELKRRNLEGFLVSHADEYQGEYTPKSAQRLTWLTGFSGSAGLAIVHHNGSAIFVDGRYILAIAEQVDQTLFQFYNSKNCPPQKWLSQQPAAKLGYDPCLHTPHELTLLQSACTKVGGELIPCTNPIDTIWANRPEPPLAPVVPHPLRYAGESKQDKCQRIGKILAKEQIDAAVLTAPDSIAWLLNIRGADLPYTPLPLCFAIIHASGEVELFLDSRKYGPELAKHLGDRVTIHAPEQIGLVLDELGKARNFLIAERVLLAAEPLVEA